MESDEKTKRAASRTRKVFAERLAVLRKDYGRSLGVSDMSMSEFAAKLGLEAERYRTYERGEREPNLFILSEIRRLTGVNLNNLIGGDIDRAA